jgi:hypothetical protein
MSQGNSVEEALHDEDGEGQLQRGDDEDDAGQRVQQPGPIEHQENGDDQRHGGKGVQDEQALQVARPAAKIEAREVVAGERRDADDDRHLHGGEEERVAEGGPHAGEFRSNAGEALQPVGDVRVPQEAPVVEMEIGDRMV